MKPLAGYRLFQAGKLTGEPGVLYDYILAGNGTFVFSSRPGLYACIPLAPATIAGLSPLVPGVRLTPRIPAKTIETMFYRAREHCLGGLQECLFHLVPESGAWSLVEPAQMRSASAVFPIGPTLGTSYETALVDVHSHHLMPVHEFSATDDASEAGCFRIFGLLLDIFENATLRMRVTIFNHSAEIDPRQVADLPGKVRTLYDHHPRFELLERAQGGAA